MSEWVYLSSCVRSAVRFKRVGMNICIHIFMRVSGSAIPTAVISLPSPFLRLRGRQCPSMWKENVVRSMITLLGLSWCAQCLSRNSHSHCMTGGRPKFWWQKCGLLRCGAALLRVNGAGRLGVTSMGEASNLAQQCGGNRPAKHTSSVNALLTPLHSSNPTIRSRRHTPPHKKSGGALVSVPLTAVRQSGACGM